MKEFLKSCVNLNNLFWLFMFSYLPYSMTGKVINSVYWGGGYIVFLVILWVLIKKGIIYKNEQGSKLGD